MEHVQVCEHGLTCQDCCWPWIGGGINPKTGYVTTRYVIDGVTVYGAHRIIWVLTRQRQPGKGHDIGHTCDVRHCCQPFHVWECTHHQNMLDMVMRGRQAHNRTPKKLSMAKARKMRKCWRDGMKQADIARKFGVSQPFTSNVLNNKVWKE